MRLAILTMAALGALMASIPASAFTYDGDGAKADPDGKFSFEGRNYLVSVHVTAEKILIQEADRKALGTYDERKKALESFLFGTGCAVAFLQQIGTSGRWEAIYGCPSNASLPKMVADQKAGLLKGGHLTPVPRSGYLP